MRVLSRQTPSLPDARPRSDRFPQIKGQVRMALTQGGFGMNTEVSGQDFPGSDLGMAVQVLENWHGRETTHSMGAGFTLVFVSLAAFGTGPSSPLSIKK